MTTDRYQFQRDVEQRLRIQRVNGGLPCLCRWVTSWGDPCINGAVIIRNRLPFCEVHRRASPARAIQNFARYVWKRAAQRGLVEQTQVLAVAEQEVERRMRAACRTDADGRWTSRAGKVVNE